MAEGRGPPRQSPRLTEATPDGRDLGSASGQGRFRSRFARPASAGRGRGCSAGFPQEQLSARPDRGTPKDTRSSSSWGVSLRSPETLASASLRQRRSIRSGCLRRCSVSSMPAASRPVASPLQSAPFLAGEQGAKRERGYSVSHSSTEDEASPRAGQEDRLGYEHASSALPARSRTVKKRATPRVLVRRRARSC
jgi:hypothetical protein